MAAPDDLCVRRLAPGQCLKVSASAGSTTQCCAGTVWVTRETDPRAFLLVAGQRFTFDRPERVQIRAAEGMKDEWVGDTGITVISLPVKLLQTERKQT